MLGSVLKLGLVVAIIALIGVALFRPATLFGVDSKALANSLGGEVHDSGAHCVKERTRGWRCELEGGTVRGVEYALSTSAFGCWKGVKVAQPASVAPAQQAVSGCIGLADMFGD
jgi:hypothetical protein